MLTNTVSCQCSTCLVPNRGKLVTLSAGKRRHLLFVKDGQRSVYDKKRQRYAEDNRTEFNCIAVEYHRMRM